MAQDLTVNIKTTSDVPQAMDKSKSAVVSFSKQVEDIQKKFSTAFKDIFLGFTAPMILLQGAISMITGAIEKAKQDAKEGLDLIAKGESIYSNAEERKAANFFKAKAAREAEIELIRKGRAELTKQVMETEAGQKLLYDEAARRGATEPEAVELLRNTLRNDPDFQKKALESFLNSEEGKMYKPIFDEDGKTKIKDTQFKGPEGFGSVIGVGANPVVEEMTKQTEVLIEIKKVLENQSPGGGVPPPFTEKPVTMRNIFNA